MSRLIPRCRLQGQDVGDALEQPQATQLNCHPSWLGYPGPVIGALPKHAAHLAFLTLIEPDLSLSDWRVWAGAMRDHM